MEKRKRARMWRTLIVLVFVALMVGKPMMILAASNITILDYHLEDSWHEDINDVSVELGRYHYHLNVLAADGTIEKVLCAVASEVAMSEAEVLAHIDAGTLKDVIVGSSDLNFFDFHTEVPIDSNRLSMDIGAVHR